FDSGTALGFGLLAQRPENFLDAFDLTLCFFPMLRVGLPDVAVRTLLRHLLQRIDERLLASEDIFQFVLKQFLDAFHRHSHPPSGQPRGSSNVEAAERLPTSRIVRTITRAVVTAAAARRSAGCAPTMDGCLIRTP